MLRVQMCGCSLFCHFSPHHSSSMGFGHASERGPTTTEFIFPPLCLLGKVSSTPPFRLDDPDRANMGVIASIIKEDWTSIAMQGLQCPFCTSGIYHCCRRPYLSIVLFIIPQFLHLLLIYYMPLMHRVGCTSNILFFLYLLSITSIFIMLYMMTYFDADSMVFISKIHSLLISVIFTVMTYDITNVTLPNHTSCNFIILTFRRGILYCNLDTNTPDRVCHVVTVIVLHFSLISLYPAPLHHGIEVDADGVKCAFASPSRLSTLAFSHLHIETFSLLLLFLLLSLILSFFFAVADRQRRIVLELFLLLTSQLLAHHPLSSYTWVFLTCICTCLAIVLIVYMNRDN
mmetsp:Transcript_44484/g.115671  ORF Transcript_44484/g.115671 Transcript_44484/m.115671 type:complete len:344 (-) Transcript_44484:85-1116(-)